VLLIEITKKHINIPKIMSLFWLKAGHDGEQQLDSKD